MRWSSPEPAWIVAAVFAVVLLDRCYTRSVKTIALPGTLRRLRHHMDHRLDLRCHPHQHVCIPFEVEGEGEEEGELIAEVVLEMVGQVMVQTVTAV